MPTQVIKTIGASGCDYTSLASWWADRKGDLVTRDTVEIAEINGESFTLPSSFIMAATDATTDATRYPILRAKAGAEFTGDFGDISGVARFTGNVSPGMKLNVAYTRASGFIFYGATFNGAAYGFISDTGGNMTLDRLGVHNITGSSTNNSSAIGFDFSYVGSVNNKITNCVANKITGAVTGTANSKNTFSYGFYGLNVANGNVFYNCTSVNIFADNNSTGTTCNATAYGFNACNIAKNCLALLTTAEAVNGTAVAVDFDAIGTPLNNGSEDTTATGDGSITGLTPASEITDTTPATCDIHLILGASSIDAGVDLSAIFTDDIEGNTRSGWSIGAHEYNYLISTFIPQLIMS
jgi:hypothetical protein